MGKKLPIDQSISKEKRWNVHEVALYLGTTTKEIYNKVHRKALPGVSRVGRSLRFNPQVIKEWEEANRMKTYEELAK